MGRAGSETHLLLWLRWVRAAQPFLRFYGSTVLLGRSVPAKHDSRCQISPELRPNRPRALWSSLRGRGSRAALVAVGFDLVQRDRGFERRARARIRSAWPFFVAPRKRRESGGPGLQAPGPLLWMPASA